MGIHSYINYRVLSKTVDRYFDCVDSIKDSNGNLPKNLQQELRKIIIKIGKGIDLHKIRERFPDTNVVDLSVREDSIFRRMELIIDRIKNNEYIKVNNIKREISKDVSK